MSEAMTIEEIALEWANSLVHYVGGHEPMKAPPPEEVFTIGLGAGKSDAPIKDILVMSETVDSEEWAKRQIGDVRRFLAKQVAGVLRDVVGMERAKIRGRFLDLISSGYAHFPDNEVVYHEIAAMTRDLDPDA